MGNASQARTFVTESRPLNARSARRANERALVKRAAVKRDRETPESDASAEQVLEIIGGDPETMLLAIRLMDRILAKRRPRRKTSRY